MPNKKRMPNNRIDIETRTEVNIYEKVSLAVMMFAGIAAAVGFAAALTTTQLSTTTKLSAVACSPVTLPSIADVHQVTLSKDDLAAFQLESSDVSKIDIQQAASASLHNALVSRKQHFMETMAADPDQALNMVLTDKVRTAITARASDCVETVKTVGGKLEVQIVDYTDKTSKNEYSLRTADGQQIILHSAKASLQAVKPGSQLEVKGYQIDGNLLFDGSVKFAALTDLQNVSTGYQTSQVTTATPVLGDQKTLVLLFNFQNTPAPTLTVTQAQAVMNQVKAYYQENSYSQIDIKSVLDAGQAADVRGWYNIPVDQTCGSSTMINALLNAANAEVNYNDYGRLVLAAPFGGGGCATWEGISTLGKVTVNSPDGDVEMSVSSVKPEFFDQYVVGHELGHGLGNNHAQFYDCGKVSVADSDCFRVEYGDYYDIMGIATQGGHFNAMHKENLGWLSATNLQTVVTNGSYVLYPMSTTTSNLKAIKIPRSAQDYIYVEFRQPIGQDTGIGGVSTEVFTGALLHVGFVGDLNYSELIDPTPPGSLANNALPVGTTFTDPATGTQIRAVSKTSSALTVSITIGKTDFTPPTASVTAPTAGANVSGNITVSANASDASGIEKVEFYLNGATTPFASDSTSPYQATLDTTHIPNGANTIFARAYDLAGTPYSKPNNSGDSANINFTVTNTDPTSPSVTLTSPTNGVTIPNPVTVSADASDTVGVWKVEFYTDSVLRETDTTSPYSAVASFNDLVPTSHTFQAKAYDYVGNVTSTGIVSVIVQPPYLTGWPQLMGGPVRSGPAVADLIPGGSLEVVASDYAGNIYAWNSAGATLIGWPKVTGPVTGNYSSPAVADIDPGFPGPEVIVGSANNKVYAWHSDGSAVAGWTNGIATGDKVLSSPAVADINKDGTKEVVVGSYDSKVYAWTANGQTVPNWPKSTLGWVRSTPVLADLDPSTPGLEVIVGTVEGNVYVWHADGSPYIGDQTAGWLPKHVEDAPGWFASFYSSPAVADIDGDGKLEVVMSSGFKTYAWHADGTPVAGWPQSTGGSGDSSPAIGELDPAHAGLEIVVGNDKVYAWHADGTPVSSKWPITTGSIVYSSPALADLDGNGSPEVIVGSMDGKVYAWQGDGTPVSPWPYNAPGAVYSSPAVADVNGDGKPEIVVGSDTNYLMVYTVATSSTAALQWPTFRQNINRTGTFNNCSDGTLVGSCSATKPLYCQTNLTLINNCSVCGCGTGTYCTGNGSCQACSCAGKTCGYDQCGNACGTPCASGYYCNGTSCVQNQPRTCRSSFLAGTPILMNDGSSRPIEGLKVGDGVKAYDVKTGALVDNNVTQVYVHETNNYLVINGKIKVTKTHPMYSRGEWVEVGRLKVGDTLTDDQSRPVPIYSIQEVDETVKVYNLEVSPDNTYIASGIVAHNKPPGSCPQF